MQSLLQERDQATERLAAEADYAFSKLLSSISEQYEGFRDGEKAFSMCQPNRFRLKKTLAVVVHLATLDCLISLATVGLAPGYVKAVSHELCCLKTSAYTPFMQELVDTPCLNIVAGRHPIVETGMSTDITVSAGLWR